MPNEHENNGTAKELTLNDVAGMIDALAQSVAKGFESMSARVDTVVETVGTLQGQMSSMETDIKTIKGDIKDVHTRIDDVEKLAKTKVSYVEYNDRLQPIEQKLGMSNP